MSIHVHRSERTDTLLIGLADLLASTPPDPFTPEVIGVPTPGIERFITQGLSRILGTSPGHHDGVCANIDFPSPASIVDRVIAQAGGIQPDTDPWLAQRAVWPLLAAIDESDEAVLANYLDGHPDRRFALASRLSRLFAMYASQRPGMLLEWVAGAEDVPPDLSWQPPLWRALRERIATPSPAERLGATCAAVAEDPRTVDLPDRLSVFGPSRLPTDHLAILRALGVHRDVHLWLADASPALWASLPEAMDVPRRADTSAALAVNPLLRSLGRDARELRMRLPDDQDQYHPSSLDGATLLLDLQRQIRDNVAPQAADVDESIQIHSCHGQPRQAEVIREVVLGLLQQDPSLEPRDILIMCPDLESFAPLLSAAFSDASDTLRLRIADRTPEQANAVLAALACLLDLVSGRIELSALLDFVARPPVCTKFDLDEDALERIRELTSQAGVRWGLDRDHRAEFQLPDTGTWTWGLDRILLGVAMSEDGLAQLDDVLPLDAVQSTDVELVGTLARIVTRLQSVRAAMTQTHTVQEWGGLLRDVTRELMDVRGTDSWQLPNALGTIGALTDTAEGYDLPLSLADITWLLADALAGRPTRSNFRSGDLTVCGLMPMRSVPHRVICLVGMDDGAFPRATRADGDDVLARNPLIGERDPRSEDRQSFLDAIMAATDHLIITYTGANDRTNEPQPPCVPLGDLLDTLEAMTEGQARTQLCVSHPLQPFDTRNFTPGALGTPTPFSHDTAALTAARRAAGPRTPEPTLAIDGDLPEQPVTLVSPQELGEFLKSPVAAYLRARIGISLRSADEPAPEQIPIDVNALEKWAIGDRTLRLLNRGEPVDRIARAERARGLLPPGALGAELLTGIGKQAEDVAQRYAGLRRGQARQVTVNVDLPNGVRVVGAVPDVFGESIVRATYSKAKPRDELALWPELLALAVEMPGASAHQVHQDGGVELHAPADPRQVLIELVDLYLAGLRSPLPLPAATSRMYAKRRGQGAPEPAAQQAAKDVWEAKFGDRIQAEFTALWGAEASFAVLLEQQPREDENWFDETSRFGMLARRLWEPILQVSR